MIKSLLGGQVIIAKIVPMSDCGDIDIQLIATTKKDQKVLADIHYQTTFRVTSVGLVGELTTDVNLSHNRLVKRTYDAGLQKVSEE